MQVRVKLYASLRKYVPPGTLDDTLVVDLQPGATIADILALLKIPEKHAKVVMIDGQQATLDAPLGDGQQVSLFPPLAGG